MHVAMLRQGQWFDEYFTFSFLRVWGLAGVMIRLRHWGMRPVSEALAYGYCRLVLATGRPLIVPVLGLAWAMLFGFLAAALKPWRGPARLGRLALLLGLPAVFLVSAPVGELFYWPLGSLAYLPALGAACYAVLVLAGPGVHTDRAWSALAGALTVGALSAELGMFLALLLPPLLFADLFWRREPGSVRHAAIMSVPFLAAGVVLAFLLHGRAQAAAEMVQAGTFHKALPSLIVALPHFAAGVLGVGDGLWASLRGVLARVLIAAGSREIVRRAWPGDVPRVRLVMVIAALGGTALLSIAGAYYQFGVLCCERHEAYRAAMYLLMYVAAGALVPRWRRPWRLFGRGGAGVLLVTAACLVGAIVRVPALIAEYRLAPAQLAARRALFASGEDKAADTLVMDMVPMGPLLQAYHLAPGVYGMSPAPPWFVQGPMLFFGKSRMQARDVK